jgi:hypothetical protein
MALLVIRRYRARTSRGFAVMGISRKIVSAVDPSRDYQRRTDL